MMHVKVSDNSKKSSGSNSTTEEKLIELPVEPEGYILMSMLKAEFPDACGLKFKTEHSSCQDLRVVNDKIFPLDEEKWDEKIVYHVTYPKDLSDTVEFIAKRQKVDKSEENKLKFGENQLDFYNGNDFYDFYKCLYNDFLQRAIKIAERYLNGDLVKSVFDEFFKISFDTFQYNLLQVEIRFETSQSASLTNSKAIALSWISKEEKHKLYINSIFWKRYLKTTDQKERQLIIFSVAMCFLHQIANLVLQWTDGQYWLRDRSKRINPYFQQMGKVPGLYFERRLFAGYTMALIVSTDSEWNENKEITAIAQDYCSCKSQQKCVCKKGRYVKLESSSIDTVWKIANSADDVDDCDLYLFDTVGHSGLDNNEMAFKLSAEVNDECDSCEDDETSRSGLEKGEMAFKLCGTHLLPQNRVYDEDEDEADSSQ